MKRLNPEKLYVTYLAATAPESLVLPRRYTLTHSDISGKLFLSIGSDYDTRRISKFYTRLMRDEVLAELINEGEGAIFRVYCHVSGGFVLGRAKWRSYSFQSELPLVLEAIRYGDRTVFAYNPELDNSPILINFHSTDGRFDKAEYWGTMLKYK